jgi:hypothetical protein
MEALLWISHSNYNYHHKTNSKIKINNNKIILMNFSKLNNSKIIAKKKGSFNKYAFVLIYKWKILKIHRFVLILCFWDEQIGS